MLGTSEGWSMSRLFHRASEPASQQASKPASQRAREPASQRSILKIVGCQYSNSIEWQRNLLRESAFVIFLLRRNVQLYIITYQTDKVQSTNDVNVYKSCDEYLYQGAFTHDVRFLGRQVGQAAADFTKQAYVVKYLIRVCRQVVQKCPKYIRRHM